MNFETSQLGRLPTELLLIILDSLCETIRPGLKQKPQLYSTRHIHSLSLVCRRLRHLSVPRLFHHLKCTNAQQLVLLKEKCMNDAWFARLIRQLDLGLDLGDTDSLDILLSLLPLLESLEWLDVDAEQVDANLLAMINAHPTLNTVAIHDLLPDDLRDLSTSTSPSLSKILLYSVVSDCTFTLQCPTLHALMSRRPRLAHLILRDGTNIKRGAGTLSLPGLENLDIHLYHQPSSPMSWLPAFVERHTSLHTIKFIGDMSGSIWRSNADIRFSLQFIDAVESEALALATALNAFTVSRTSRALSLVDWEVTAIEITIQGPAGVAALSMASSLAPSISSLEIRMPRLMSSPLIHVDDLILALSRFPSLQVLKLRDTYRHFLFKGHLPPSDSAQKTSYCMIANAALQWLMSRVAQSVLSLQLVNITDEGHDRAGHSLHPWRLKAAYRVQSNRDLESHGTPEFVMNYRYKGGVQR
ncbi:hypothetical protein C8R43DRAFT_1234622 [Mycena crocata]|nr:hypothetical protein C8R43DRAFT_1234622 [Mycena crocata]